MKKNYLMLAAVAALFAACSSDSLTTEKQSPQTQDAAEQAVNFSAYVGRGTTRAGQTGTMTTTVLRTSTADDAVSNGFGVFGYYTNNVPYGQTAIPDFFYNEKVYYNAGAWAYSPIKYWPNEFGTGAESAGQDKLTFFAYAPYVQVNPSTGRVKESEKSGIIALTSNTASGDPHVKYIVDFDPNKRVDLCYGVANSNFTSSVDGANNSVELGKPFIDVIKPKISDKIFFNFKHALASLNIKIDADIDELSHGTTNNLDGNTKIYVRKVTFEGFADKGSLNLNSEAVLTDYVPNWFELNSINRRLSSGTVTIYDGRRDGREGQAKANASNETPKDLNENIIQNDLNNTPGVPATSQANLFNSTDPDAPIFVIPTDENLKVTIVYDVETADDNLSTYLSDGKTKGSSVENTITKEIKISGAPFKLAAGKAYNISLHLGMTSVKFDAAVTAWPDALNTDNTDLPINAPTAEAVAGGAAAAITIPANAAVGVFKVTGLTANEATVNAIVPGSSGITGTVNTPTTADASGSVNVNYTINANNTVKQKTGSITVTNGSVGTLGITQEAAPLGLSITTKAKAGQTEIALDASAEMAAADWTTNANYTVVRKRAGVTKTLTKDTGSGEDKYDVAAVGSGDFTGKITLGADAQAGDVYTITIQAGNAAAETVSFTVVKQDGTLNAFANLNQTYSIASPITLNQQATVGSGEDGTITYSIAKTTDTGTTTATISNLGVVTLVTPQSGDEFTVTATVADGAKYTYATKTTTYTITITD